MKQSKRETHKEVLANQIIGIAGGWCIVAFLFPLFDYLPQTTVATISSALFFIWNYTRTYVIRRIFERRRLKRL